MKKVTIHILVIPIFNFFGIKFDTNLCYPMYIEKEMTDLEIIQLLSCTHFPINPRNEARKIIESKVNGDVYEIKLQALRIPVNKKDRELSNLRAWGWKY